MGFSEQLKKASRVGAFFVLAFGSLPALAFCPSPGALPEAAVARVVDGDTLRLSDGRSVRLIGINAPELGRAGRKAEAFAEAARERLQGLVRASGGRVMLHAGVESHDRYGRLLAHAYDARGRNLEAALLAEGLGFMVALAPNTALTGCHQAAERQARQARLGVWRKPPLQSAAALRQGGFALLDGRVERAERNGAGFWLEFDGPLVVQVPPPALEAFDAAWLAALPGKTLQVRGWVLDRRGRSTPQQARWLLRVSHPAMLEVVR